MWVRKGLRKRKKRRERVGGQGHEAEEDGEWETKESMISVWLLSVYNDSDYTIMDGWADG